MKINLSAYWLSAVFALFGSMVTPAAADVWNKETRLEVKEPLEIPGQVLAPGTYIFRLAESQSDRNIVEVFSEDADGRQKLVTTIHAISVYSLDTPDKSIVRLEERPSGRPPAIQSWFYPGDNTGWEFVYPKSDRLELAANSAPAEQPAPIADSAPVVPDPPAVAWVPEPSVESPALEQVLSEQDEPPALVPDKSEDFQGSADRMLPETAGNSVSNAAVGLAILGLGLIAVSVSLRRVDA
jgi:hypothetical protein